MRNLAELNINEYGMPTSRLAPTTRDIASFEAAFGVQLPSEYLSLLQFANGGHPELDTFLPDGHTPGAEWAINHFYYLDSDTMGFRSLWRATKEWQPVLGSHALPIAEDGGGNILFLNLKKGIATVQLCIHDENFRVVDVCGSFEAFIDRLHLNPDHI